MRQDNDLDEPSGSDDLGTPRTGGHDAWTDVGDVWRTDDPWQLEYPPPGEADSPATS